MRKLWSSGRAPVAPRAFKGKLGRFAPQFSGYNQHDSQVGIARLGRVCHICCTFFSILILVFGNAFESSDDIRWLLVYISCMCLLFKKILGFMSQNIFSYSLSKWGNGTLR